MNDPRRQLAAGALGLVLVVAVAACGSASQPGTSPGAGASGSPAASAPPPTAVPGASDGGGASGGTTDGGSGAGTGGSTGGNPGTGILDPGLIGGLFPKPPADGEPTLVTPVAGVRDPHTVSPTGLEPAVDGRHAWVRVSWWSGVEPCTALAGVDVARDGTDIIVTVKEGSAAAPDVMCTEQALFKAVVVDLGELDPGTYTVASEGEVAPVTFTIS